MPKDPPNRAKGKGRDRLEPVPRDATLRMAVHMGSDGPQYSRLATESDTAPSADEFDHPDVTAAHKRPSTLDDLSDMPSEDELKALALEWETSIEEVIKIITQ